MTLVSNRHSLDMMITHSQIVLAFTGTKILPVALPTDPYLKTFESFSSLRHIPSARFRHLLLTI